VRSREGTAQNLNPIENAWHILKTSIESDGAHPSRDYRYMDRTHAKQDATCTRFTWRTHKIVDFLWPVLFYFYSSLNLILCFDGEECLVVARESTGGAKAFETRL
jgi:hypothetical protein